MSRPNLSIERIALTLAALGTSAVLAACAKSEPAASVQADKASTPTMSASAAAEAPPPPVATAVANEPQPTDGLRKGDPTAASAAPARPKMNMRAPGSGGTGQASCGAGTCTADPKKK